MFGSGARPLPREVIKKGSFSAASGGEIHFQKYIIFAKEPKSFAKS